MCWAGSGARFPYCAGRSVTPTTAGPDQTEFNQNLVSAGPSPVLETVFEYLMRFYASHLGSGLWGLYDGGVMTWLASDLSENEAKQQAADRNVIFDQWGQRQERERRQVAEAWWQAPSATPADEE